MSRDSPTTHWLHLLKAGEDSAATELWHRYFQRLLGLARRKLGSNPTRVADEEDIALSAFHSFCRGAAGGNFAQLDNRDDLWQVLAVITTRKAIKQIKRERAQKRGGGQVRGESVFHQNDPARNQPSPGIQDAATGGPSGEFMAIADEAFTQLLEQLPDASLREVALLKLEGWSNEEIAQQISRHPRSVERKLQIIRKHWESSDESS